MNHSVEGHPSGRLMVESSDKTWSTGERNSKPQHPVVVVTGDGGKVQRCKQQYCIGTWNVRSMNQGKLEVLKQMARVNMNILGISKLKGTEMDEFTADDLYIYYYYCGQESLRRKKVATS